MKKALSIVLLLALLLAFAPYAAAEDLLPSLDPSWEYPASGEGSFEPPSFEPGERIYRCGDYQYTLLEDGAAEIFSYWFDYYLADDDSSRELVIPEELDGHTVTSIGNGSMGMNGFKRVVIPDTVTKIGGGAFALCQELESVVIPDSVTEIGRSAFAYCFALADLTISDGVTTIGDEAFVGCHALTDLTIPDSVTELGENPFRYCMSLASVEVSPDHPALELVDGVLFSRADRRLITYLFTKDEPYYEIPEGTSSIGAGAFANNLSLRSVVIPESVTELRDSAFAECANLENITIPGSVRVIGNNAFALCKSLKSVAMADGVEAIGECAFAQCLSLESVAIPDSVASFGDGVFSGCESLESVAIPAGTAEIGVNPFTGCTSLEKISVTPDHPALEVIDGVLFGREDRRLICYPRTKEDASYEIPAGTAVIGDHAFAGCESLERVVIPESVTTVCDWAFYHCGSLADVNIPGGVTYIGENTFSFCKNLTLTVERDSFAERYCAWKRLDHICADG